MKVTAGLDDRTLDALLAATDERKKGTAVAKAVDEFLKRKKAREFGRLPMEGAFDYPTATAQIEKQGF
jgi:hypothetical protein